MWSLVWTHLVRLLIAAVPFWLFSILIHNVAIVDTLWSLTFIAAAALYATDTTRSQLTFFLVCIWALRLSAHIGARLVWQHRGKEDWRYAAFRRHFGEKSYWWFSLFQVFWLQGVISVVVSLSLLGAMRNDGPKQLWALDYFAVVVWAIGFVFESVGDWQLWAFKSDPSNEGKVLRSGLFALTRHPNYFGDSCVHLAFFLLSAANGHPLLGFIGFALMTFLLLRVSGVTMLEKGLKKKKGAEFEQYQKQVASFVPFVF